MDWSTRRLDNSWTSQLTDWTTRGLADATGSRVPPAVVLEVLIAICITWLCGHIIQLIKSLA